MDEKNPKEENCITQKPSAVVNLNVGGHHYTTSLQTLTKFKDSMLATMFSGRHDMVTDTEGRVFIDADGSRFIYILNYLRFGELPPKEVATQIYKDVDYFGLQSLSNKLLRYPTIAKQIALDNLIAEVPGYRAILDGILDIMLKKVPSSDFENDLGLYSCVKISISTTARVPVNLASTQSHTCFYYGTHQEKIDVDYITDLLDTSVKEDDVLSIILAELDQRGFSVDLNPAQCFKDICRWHCTERCITYYTCSKKIYHINFIWKNV